jgi:hypothetical protein
MPQSITGNWFSGRFNPRQERKRKQRRSTRPRVECLEDRAVPTVLSTQLLLDHFDNNDVNAFSSNWRVVQGATHDLFLRQNPPSNAYAIRLDVDASGGNLLTSRPFDLSSETHVTLSYYYERQGGGAATAAGDDLVVEALNSSGNWVEIDRQLGAGPAMSQFQQQKIALASDFLYNGFQFRFRRVGAGGDWFIDDVKLAAATGYANYWSNPSQQTGLYYPNVLSFNFPNTPAPTGGGSLTITAVSDLGGYNHFLTLSAEGQVIGKVFGTDGRSFSTITTTLPLSKSLLQTLTADGTITITATPDPGVFASPNTFTPITVRLEYATGTGNPAPVVDLNGPNVSGTDFATTFTPGSGPVLIGDYYLSVTDSAGTSDAAVRGLYLVGTNGSFAIDRVDPNNPQSPQTITSGGNLLQPRDVAVDANGDLLIGEFSYPFNSTVSLVRVNPFSGSQEVFSSGASVIFNVAANRATGEIFIADLNQSLLRVDPITGAQSSVGGGGGFVENSMSIDSNGDVLGGSNRMVLRVNRVTGAVTVVTSNGYLIGNVEGTAVEPSGTILAVSGSFGAGNVVRINPVTGAQTLLTSGGLLNTPRDVTVGDNGDIYVLDSHQAIIKVDPVTGQQTLLTTNFTFQQEFGIAALLPGSGGATSIIQSGSVTLSNLLDGTAEVLAADTTGTRITASYNSATGVLSLTGPDSPANYQRVLRTATYRNTAANPNTTPRLIRFVLNDGTLNSQVVTTTVSIHVDQPPTAVAGGPYAVAEGGSITLDGTGSSDPDGSISNYEWDFNYNGSTFNVAATGASPTFSAGSADGPSSRTVALRVTDNEGASSIGTAALTLTNTPPTATLSNNGPVNEGSAVTISFANPSDPSSADTAAGFHYSFALSAAGLASGYAGAGTGSSAPFTFEDNGTYTVFGRIFDKDGGSTDYTTAVTVTNAAPSATFANNGPVNEASAVTVSFANPSDPSSADTAAGFHYSIATSGANLAGSYDEAGTDTSASFTFDDNGSSTIYGRIFDKDNGYTDYQTTIVVNDLAPMATLSNSGPVNEASAATVSFSNPSDPSSADAAAGFHYSFALATSNLAGSYGAAGTTSSASFTFDDNGSYTVYGRIFDKDNGYTDYQTTVTVNNVSPAATLSGNGPVNEGSPATISFTGASDPSGTDTNAGFHYSFALAAADLAASYAAAGSPSSVSFTFDDNGSYPVFGRIFDKDNGFTDYQTTVVVNNVAPTATLSNNGPVNEASSAGISFSNLSDPSSADTAAGFHYSFALAVANLAGSYTSAGSASSASFTFDDNGSYIVYGRIFDKDNGYTDYTTPITVNNVAPTATLSNNGPVNEGSAALVSFSGATDPSSADVAAGFHYSIALSTAALAGSYAAAGTTASAPFTFDDNGSYSVYGRVFDKDNGYTDYQTTVVFNNVVPTATLSNNGPVNEASAATVFFSNPSDPSSADTAAGFHYSFALAAANLAGSYTSAGSASSASFTFNDNGSFTVYGRIFDKDNGFTDYTTVVTVNNLPPAAGVSGPATGVRGQPRLFTFTASDPSPVDQAASFTFVINWGDGSAQQTVAGVPASLQVSHVFVGTGSYTVKVWATDKDGGQSPSPGSGVIVISAVEMQGTTLVVGGTLAKDTIVLKPSDASGNLSVTINGTGMGIFQPAGQILIYAQAGDDTVQLQSAKIRGKTVYITVPAVLYGGDGNDTLDASGSTANNVLLGEAGNDSLQGGSGRDLLIGGLGADTLRGGDDEDIVIGGTTDFDNNNLTALNALMAEWGRTDLAYSVRLNHLTGSVSGGQNGSYFLNPTTVHDDAAIDQLFGEKGQDWFFARTFGSLQDVLNDKAQNEIATLI